MHCLLLSVSLYLYTHNFKCRTGLFSGVDCPIERSKWHTEGDKPLERHHALIPETITEPKDAVTHFYASLHLMWQGYITSQKAIKEHLCFLSAIILCPTEHWNFRYCYSNVYYLIVLYIVKPSVYERGHLGVFVVTNLPRLKHDEPFVL